MLTMRNVKTEYNKMMMQKQRNQFFVSHKNESLFTFWHAIIFLLLCDNKNISPWHDIINDAQNKNLELQEK